MYPIKEHKYLALHSLKALTSPYSPSNLKLREIQLAKNTAERKMVPVKSVVIYAHFLRAVVVSVDSKLCNSVNHFRVL